MVNLTDLDGCEWVLFVFIRFTHVAEFKTEKDAHTALLEFAKNAPANIRTVLGRGLSSSIFDIDMKYTFPDGWIKRGIYSNNITLEHDTDGTTTF